MVNITEEKVNMTVMLLIVYTLCPASHPGSRRAPLCPESSSWQDSELEQEYLTIFIAGNILLLFVNEIHRGSRERFYLLGYTHWIVGIIKKCMLISNRY